MSFLVFVSDGLVDIDHEATPELLESMLHGTLCDAVLPGPGLVRAYWTDEALLMRCDPNIAGSLFLQKHGVIPRRGVVHGLMALVATDDEGGAAELPAWVEESLRELAPMVRHIEEVLSRPEEE